MRNKLKVYIAGPMRNYFQLNFPAFDEMRDRLLAAGNAPLNPADLDRELGIGEGNAFDEAEVDMRETARRDCTALSTCDAIVFLEGWEDIAGATAEAAVAQWLGLKVLDPVTLEEHERPLLVRAEYGPVPEDLVYVEDVAEDDTWENYER